MSSSPENTVDHSSGRRERLLTDIIRLVRQSGQVIYSDRENLEEYPYSPASLIAMHYDKAWLEKHIGEFEGWGDPYRLGYGLRMNSRTPHDQEARLVLYMLEETAVLQYGVCAEIAMQLRDDDESDEDWINRDGWQSLVLYADGTMKFIDFYGSQDEWEATDEFLPFANELLANATTDTYYNL